MAVAGCGVPVMPDGLRDDAIEQWEIMAALLSGVAFEQDSFVLGRIAVWIARLAQLDAAVNALDCLVDAEECDKLLRLMLAVERNIDNKCAKFGLTPRDRQLLLIPKPVEELDEFEQMMKDHE
jgi:hypothetical protein